MDKSMEKANNPSSFHASQQPLGLRFTIDYLLFNKGSDGEKGQEERPEAAEAQPQTPVSDRDCPKPQSPEAGPEGSEGENEDETGEGEEAVGTNPRDKPSQSYIALISMAILASEEKKLLLCDIYQWIMDHYPYFKSKDKNWKNSVRHNLSLNECFVKAGRSDNGKGHFWAVHPANVEDFSKGEYHHRRARRRIRSVAGQLAFSLPPPYHPPRNSPYWWYPPAHPVSYLPARVYWTWAALPASRDPSAPLARLTPAFPLSSGHT